MDTTIDDDTDSDTQTDYGECKTDDQCNVHNDCCNCLAISPLEDPMICEMMCLQSKCQEIGFSLELEAICVNGRCVLDTNCDDSRVQCDAMTPMCDYFMVPAVAIDNSCYLGGCINEADCP
jgi:hypothetical protein